MGIREYARFIRRLRRVISETCDRVRSFHPDRWRSDYRSSDCGESASKRAGQTHPLFAKNVEQRSPGLQLLLQQLERKYGQFESLDDLERQVKEAIGQISALSLRAPRPGPRVPSVLHHLSKLVGTDIRVRITPIIPRASLEGLFQVWSACSETVAVYRAGSQETIHIPTGRVVEVLDGGPDAYKTLVLNGRLQFGTANQRWSFHEEKPDPNSEYGFARPSSGRDPYVAAFMRGLAIRFDFYWAIVNNLLGYLYAGWEVCYDDEGRYLLIQHPSQPSILIAKRLISRFSILWISLSRSETGIEFPYP